MPRYTLSPEAEEDLADIRAYYLTVSSARTARHVLREITLAMRFLGDTPGARHKREDLTDDAVKFWRVFSYLIIYDPAPKPIAIVRVIHASQDIKHLLRRMPPHA